MDARRDDDELKRDHADEIADAVAKARRDFDGRRLKLSELFHGDQYAAVREQIKRDGKVHSAINGRTLHVATRPIDGSDDHEIIAIAAVARDPGRTQDYIDVIADFQARLGGASQRGNQIKQYWEMYKVEGLVNNAINKYAALLSVGGRFKVRKAKKGKQQKAMETAQGILDFWCRNVNGPIETGVATTSRGVKALTEQGIRVALVEGDWMGRQVWGQHQIPALGGTFSLPLTIQTLSMEFMEPVGALQGLGEYWYWKPAEELRKLIKGEDKDQPKEVKQLLKRLFDNEITKQIKKDDRALLTSALLCHVKHRGSDREPYGESFIEPAKLGIRYARAVSAADMVSMENVINRLMLVMVGSADPASPYSKPEVAQARASLMQSFFEDPGPNMTIVWQGDDVKVESHGAMDDVMDLTERHRIGERKIMVALGVPKALIDGTSDEGKAAGWAALIAATGMAEHLGSAFARQWTEVGMRILVENGFVDIDIEFEFDRTNLADKEAERTQNRADYVVGLITIYDMLLAMGKDPEAQFLQKCKERGLDPSTTTWEVAFTPPQGMAGQGDGGIQGQGPGKDPGSGRTPDDQTGKPKEPAAPEAKSPTENK